MTSDLSTTVRGRPFRRHCLYLLVAQFVVTAALSAADYYATPGPVRHADGSMSKPWDLGSALRHPAIRAGDTLWLDGGLYTGNFVSVLEGTEDKPITIRARPGQRVTIDSNGLSSPLKIRGKWTTWWGLELTNSYSKRVTTEAGSFPSDVAFGSAVDINAPYTRLINLVIHDHGTGVCAMSNASFSEVYGCLIYNNGWQGPERGHGDGIVAQNKSGTMKFHDNVIFNQFGLGIQVYGTKDAHLHDFDIAGNAVFNNGALSRDGVTTNIWIGGGATAEQISVTQNYTYNSVPWGVHLHAGSGAENKNLTVTGNYFAGHVRIQNWEGLTVNDNLLAADANLLEWIQDKPNTAVSWDRNQYFSREEKYLPFGVSPNGGLFTFHEWKTRTSFDADSQYTRGRPSGHQVVLRPNKYDSNRAHVVVYNWEGASKMSVDAGKFLKVGDEYEVRNGQNYFATPVLSGKFDGQPLQLPMNELLAAGPNGFEGEVPRTGPEFNVFVVERLVGPATSDSTSSK